MITKTLDNNLCASPCGTIVKLEQNTTPLKFP
jgi:hypothetical protein